MYTDFESILELVQETTDFDPNKPYTKVVNNHIPSGFCVYSKFSYSEVTNPLKLYRGEDCVDKFCGYIEEEAKRLCHMFPEKPMDPLTEKQMFRYEKVTICHICHKEGFSDMAPKVMDHCHYTGKYRGPAHSLCNLGYKIPSYIPVIFHNLSSYDAYLFIKGLGKRHEGIEVIATNKEDYIPFSVKVVVDKYLDDEGNEKKKTVELRFIDSFKFMASSLDSLVKNFVNRGQNFFGLEEDKYDLLTRKGIYPYEYVLSWDKFSETQLPPIEFFYSNLNDSKLSEDDYQHVQNVWKAFNIKNELYLENDVILLANVFEAFRDTCLKHHRLDPAHFYMSPGLAWKACLKKTGVKLELLTDPDMLLMFEQGIRVGITQVVHGYAKANNPYMGEKFKPDEESSYLQYLDANNLYGWAMS